MRIALIHSAYSAEQPSGENEAVLAAERLLSSGEHDVAIFGGSTDNLRSSTYAMRAAMRVATGVGQSPMRELLAYKPDVVHVHNTFPNIGKAWIPRWRGPLVATLHNYRPLCAAATLFRDGQVCTACPDSQTAVPSMVHACYRGSRLATAPVALSTRFESDKVLSRADILFCLSNRMKEVYASYGVPEAKLRVLHNFVDRGPSEGLLAPAADSDEGYFLYAGRLAPEKGILDLVRRWPSGVPLKVAGSGPEADAVATAVARQASIEYLGPRTRGEVRALLSGAVGLVFPSRWLEGLALVCLEALACGTPILAWMPSAAASTVREFGIGLVGSDDLLQDLTLARRRFPLLREHCLQTYNENFTPEAHARTLLSYYEEVLPV